LFVFYYFAKKFILQKQYIKEREGWHSEYPNLKKIKIRQFNKLKLDELKDVSCKAQKNLGERGRRPRDKLCRLK